MSIEQFSGRPRIFEMGVNRAGCATFVIHGFANMAIDPVQPYQDYKNRLLEIVVDGAELGHEAQCSLTFGISDYFRQELVGAPVAERDFDFNLTRTACSVKSEGERKSIVQVRYDFNTAFRKRIYQPDGSLGPDPDGGANTRSIRSTFKSSRRRTGRRRQPGFPPQPKASCARCCARAKQ